MLGKDEAAARLLLLFAFEVRDLAGTKQPIQYAFACSQQKINKVLRFLRMQVVKPASDPPFGGEPHRAAVLDMGRREYVASKRADVPTHFSQCIRESGFPLPSGMFFKRAGWLLVRCTQAPGGFGG